MRLFVAVLITATSLVKRLTVYNRLPSGDMATAIGTYTGFQSIMALLASASAGLVWQFFGAPAPFLLAAGGSFGVMVYLWRGQEKKGG